MSVTLRADVRLVDGATALREGWRGLIDFGETWSRDDADLWPSSSGDLPTGEPLTYGCELTEFSTPTGSALRLWFADTPRPVMITGAEFVLRDGPTTRATGTFL